MRFLVDTHIWLWWLDGGEGLSNEAKGILENPDYQIFASAINVWEVCLKASLGKLEVNGDLQEATVGSEFEFLAFSHRHALALQGLAPHHKDPFDRALLAQARSERLCLLTSDSTLRSYGDQVELKVLS